MAGWHLVRNNTLFFRCAVFTTLVLLCLYPMPYFPSMTPFVSPQGVAISTDSCIHSLHRVNFSIASGHPKMSWDWVESTEVSKCGFKKFNQSEVSNLLKGSWIVVAGDSESRLTALSLLTSVMGREGQESIRADLSKRHTDYPTTLKDIGLKLDFLWAPYADNLTKFLSQLRQNKTCPDLILVGSQIWEMLNVNNATRYGASLKVLRENVLALLNENRNTRRSPHFFWIGMPKIVKDVLSLDWKVLLGDELRHLYDNELIGSKLLSENGGPLFKLDLYRLSDSCGRYCSGDGFHYDEYVYDSAVQIMFNALTMQYRMFR